MGPVRQLKAVTVEESVGDSVKQALPLVTMFSLPFCPVQFVSVMIDYNSPAKASITASSLLKAQNYSCPSVLNYIQRLLILLHRCVSSILLL